MIEAEAVRLKMRSSAFVDIVPLQVATQSRGNF